MKFKELIEELENNPELTEDLLSYMLNEMNSDYVHDTIFEYINSNFIQLGEIGEITGRTPQAATSMIKTNSKTFPQPYSLGNRNYYLESEVVDWAEKNNKISPTYDPETKYRKSNKIIKVSEEKLSGKTLKIESIERDRWMKELEKNFLKQINIFAEFEDNSKESLLKAFHRVINVIEKSYIGNFQNIVWLSASKTAINIIAPIKSQRLIHIEGVYDDFGLYHFQKFTKDFGIKLTRKEFIELCHTTFDHIGRKLSKEIMKEYYCDNFHLRFSAFCSKDHENKGFDEFLNYLDDIRKHYQTFNNEELDSILYRPKVTKIYSSTNSEDRSFDFIDVEIPILSDVDKSSLKKLTKKNLKLLVRTCLQEIASNHRFISYGVPINYLKIGKIVITNQNILLITFELKGAKSFEETNLF